MNPQEYLKNLITKCAAQEATEALQARLDSAGLQTDLSGIPAAEVSEAFINAMSFLLERPISELTSEQIRAITAKVTATSTGLEEASQQTTLSVEGILQGFKKVFGGAIEITLPKGASVQAAGELLNAAAIEKGMKYPVFFEGDAEYWEKHEANASLRTEPGQAYHFTIATSALSKTRDEQTRYHGKGAPLGAIAIAEACERLQSEDRNSLFKDALGNKIYLRGATPGVVLDSDMFSGVIVHGHGDNRQDDFVAFATANRARD
jgi:hypothetical protein